MRSSLWRLAVAGCVLNAVFAVTACFGAGDSLLQPIQYLPKINLHRTVTHISNPLGKKDVEPKTISRTDKWRFVMAEAATNRVPRYDELFTKNLYELQARPNSVMFAESSRIACMTGEMMEINKKAAIKTDGPNALSADTGMVCLKWLKLSADEQRGLATLVGGDSKRDPDRDLLAPYRKIVEMKGIVGTNETALHLIDAVSSTAANDPAVRDSNKSFPFTLYSNQTKPFYVSPGIAFDATFTKRVLDFIATGAMPPKPTMSRERLDETTRGCYDAKQGTNTSGQCAKAAEGQSYHYLTPTIISSNETRQR